MQLCKCPKGNLNKKLLHINKICKHLCKDCLFPHVGGIDDHVEVLVDVVHNLGLKEGLGAVVHNLVAELGLGDILPKLLDPRAPGLLGAALVNDLITLVLRGLPILESRHQFLDHFKLSAEEWILVGVHDVVVHLEYVTVDARYGVQKAVEGGRDLKLLEEAGDHTGSGGARQTDLTTNHRRDHRAVLSKSELTWSLMMTGVTILVPVKAELIMSKSFSAGAAELQVGILI